MHPVGSLWREQDSPFFFFFSSSSDLLGLLSSRFKYHLFNFFSGEVSRFFSFLHTVAICHVYQKFKHVIGEKVLHPPPPPPQSFFLVFFLLIKQTVAFATGHYSVRTTCTF